MRSSFGLTGVAVSLSGAVVVFACGDDHQFDGGTTSSDAGAGGAETASSASGNGGSSGTVRTNGGGDTAGTSTDAPGGATNSLVGSDGGAGGAGGLPECADGFSDWLTSSFAFPDGDVIGTADFPSMPWVKAGSLKIDTGRLVGPGLAVISQGSAYPYAGSRLRFRARFTDSNQEISAAFNTAKDGSGGVHVEVDGYGRLSVTEGKTTIAFADVAPLETGVDWFVESFFRATSATVVLSRGNYASAKQGQVVATLETDALKGAASGTKAAIELDANGTSPAVDEIAIARCGMSPPQYEAKLIDTFERPDGTNLGKAELPATAAWISGSAKTKIAAGALQTGGDLQGSSIPLLVPLEGLRIRTTVRAGDGPNPFLWASVSFNVSEGSGLAPSQGFWVWGGPSDGAFYTGIFTGGGELKHPTQLSMTTKYYAQLDRDGDVAVVTVRSESFTGPILGMQYAAALAANPYPGGFLVVADAGGPTRFEDLRVDSFPFAK